MYKYTINFWYHLFMQPCLKKYTTRRSRYADTKLFLKKKKNLYIFIKCEIKKKKHFYKRSQCIIIINIFQCVVAVIIIWMNGKWMYKYLTKLPILQHTYIEIWMGPYKNPSSYTFNVTNFCIRYTEHRSGEATAKYFRKYFPLLFLFFLSPCILLSVAIVCSVIESVQKVTLKVKRECTNIYGNVFLDSSCCQNFHWYRYRL